MKLGVDLGLADTFGLAVVGDPGEVRAKIAKYAESGVTHLLCAFGAGAVEPAVTRESLELFAREVMPAFSAAVSDQPAAISGISPGQSDRH
jgi:alkanesulfonate monooxygenase SsuD/methylene tetrahydromethanopterin reductase-like flavin-dependent oxidoreductase (luciferase family)